MSFPIRRRLLALCHLLLASAAPAPAQARLLDAQIFVVTQGGSASENFDRILGEDIPQLTSSVLLGLLTQPGSAESTLIEWTSSSSVASGTLEFFSNGDRVFVSEIRSPSNQVWEIDPRTGATLAPSFRVFDESECRAALGDSFYFGDSRYDGISGSPSEGTVLEAAATDLPYCATDSVDDRLFGWELTGTPPNRDLDLYRIDPITSSRQRVGLFDLPPRTVPFVHFDRDAVYFSYFLDASGDDAQVWRWAYGALIPTPIGLPAAPDGGSDWALQDATEGVLAFATFPSGGQTLGTALLLDDVLGGGITFPTPVLVGGGSLAIAVPEPAGAALVATALVALRLAASRCAFRSRSSLLEQTFVRSSDRRPSKSASGLSGSLT